MESDYSSFVGPAFLGAAVLALAFACRRGWKARPQRRGWWISAALLAAGGTCIAVAAVFGTSTIDADGILREPLLVLIPLGFLLMLAGLASTLVIAILSALRRYSRDSAVE